jgi:hypothetical protein
MDAVWNIDLSREKSDIRNIENVTMGIIASFRAMKYAKPCKIKIKPDGIGVTVLDRLIAAKLPAKIWNKKRRTWD